MSYFNTRAGLVIGIYPTSEGVNLGVSTRNRSQTMPVDLLAAEAVRLRDALTEALQKAGHEKP